MQYLLDLSLVALCVIVILLHFYRGLIRSVFGMAKTMLSILFTYLWGSAVAAFVCDKWMSGWVTDYIHGRLLSLFDAGTESFDIAGALESLPTWLTSLLDRLGLDAASLAGDLADQTAADAGALREFSASLAMPVANMISGILGHVAVFLASMLVLTIAAFICTKLADLPMVKQIDRVLGLLLGIILALVYASVYAVLLYAILNLVEGANSEFAFQAAFENSYVFRWFYDNNIFRWLFGIG